MRRLLVLACGVMLMMSTTSFAAPVQTNSGVSYVCDGSTSQEVVWRPALIGGSSTQTDGHGNYRGK
jgi:hypothetical protein